MAEQSKTKEKTVLKALGLCSYGMGGEVCNVDVKDGKIVRIRPLKYDDRYEAERRNPWRIEARGEVFEAATKTLMAPQNVVYKKKVYSPNRILYPLKRVDWDPKGERNTQNRGISKYERISWDEATQIIADELTRIIDEYGPYAIMAQADGHGENHSIHGPHGCQCHLLEMLGGFTQQARTPDSWEGWYWGAKHIWSMDPVGQMMQPNLLKDMFEHTTLMLYWGADPETTPWGWCGQNASRICYHFDKLGIKNLFISPDFNYSAAVHPGKWIPVLPNTDAALQLAIANTWVREGLVDYEYLDTHSIGYYEFEDYVMGKVDGIEKTPEWASPLCGVPVRHIKALAREWAANRTIIQHVNGGGYIRGPYSTEPGRLEVVLLAMQGLGKHGTGQFINFNFNLFSKHETNAAPRNTVIPNAGAIYHGAHLGKPDGPFVPKTLMPKVLSGEYDENNPLVWYAYPAAGINVKEQYIRYEWPTKDYPTIKMLWCDSVAYLSSWTGGTKMIEGYRNPNLEFVVTQSPWFENEAALSDIILPTTTKLEQLDMDCDMTNANFSVMVRENPAIEPLGEAVSDWEAVLAVADKLGLKEGLTLGLDYEDLLHAGWEGSGCKDLVSYEEWTEKEYYVVPTAEDWEDDEPGMHAFYRDPKENPLQTPSGLLEITCPKLTEIFPDDPERRPYPTWIPEGESHQESLLSDRAKEYPFIMMSNHPRFRFHSMLDEIPWYHEVELSKIYYEGYPYEPVWINPQDAERLGIKHGDIVEIANERGTVLGGAFVTNRIMPGVVNQDHGARVDLLDNARFDRGGANNLICPVNTTSKNCVGEVTQNFLVSIRKADMDALKAQYPEAFARKFDTETGVLMDDWII